MKRCYVAIGGVGCRALKIFASENLNDETRFFYFDTDVTSNDQFDAGDMRFVFKDYPYGTGCLRALGRDMFRTYLYTEEIPNIIDSFFETDELQLCLVTTSFGGFGSAVVFELADYLCAKIMKYAGGNISIDVKVIAFTQGLFGELFAQNTRLGHVHEINTLEFINEYNYRKAKCSKYFPDVELYAVFSPEISIADFPKIIGQTPDVLEKLDIKESLCVKSKVDAQDVFISYSTVDQAIADKLVKKLNADGIGTWIATENMKSGSYPGQITRAIAKARVFVVLISASSIKSPDVMAEINLAFERLRDGIVIIPFFIEDTELDDDCKYYLGRQEWFDGKTPPLDERFEYLAERIREILY